MKLNQPARRPLPETVTPLINVVFLLLIFFMMAGRPTAGDARFEVTPPRAASGTAAEAAPITIAVTADGRIAVGGEPVDLAHLPSAVAAAKSEDVSRVRVRADAQADAARVVRIMARVRETETTSIDLLTLDGSGS